MKVAAMHSSDVAACVAILNWYFRDLRMRLAYAKAPTSDAHASNTNGPPSTVSPPAKRIAYRATRTVNILRSAADATKSACRDRGLGTLRLTATAEACNAP